jgi:2-polyprenyl-6-hydroxyphenyl methylase/3-demethylubiquinone-9 3-methyltransferase
MSRAVEYHDALSATWSARYAGRAFGARRALLASVLDAHVRPGSRWLDLGCGSGILTGDLLERGATVVAVDGSGPMLAHAQASIPETLRHEVQWIQSDAQALTMLGDKAFDGVVCSSVLEYLDDPRAAIREAARVLKDHGRLIVSVPRKRSLVRTIQKVARRAGRFAGRDLYAYLDVSQWELSERGFAAWLRSECFEPGNALSFDPIVPPALHRLLVPSLLIVNATRMPRQ